MPFKLFKRNGGTQTVPVAVAAEDTAKQQTNTTLAPPVVVEEPKSSFDILRHSAPVEIPEHMAEQLPSYPDPTSLLSDRYAKNMLLVQTVISYANFQKDMADKKAKYLENVKIMDSLPDFEVLKESDSTTNAQQAAPLDKGKVANFDNEQFKKGDGETDTVVDTGIDLSAAEEEIPIDESQEPIPVQTFISLIPQTLENSRKAALDVSDKIKTLILPDLETCYSELESKRNELANVSKKDAKGVIKQQKAGVKLFSDLDTASKGSLEKVDLKKDPYLLSLSYNYELADLQKSMVNRRELLLSQQKAIEQKEAHVVALVKRKFGELGQLLVNWHTISIDFAISTGKVSDRMSPEITWDAFLNSNKGMLIVNDDIEDKKWMDNELQIGSPLLSDSIKPLYAGTVGLRTGTLSKEYNNFKAVITPSSYFYTFGDKKGSPNPDLALYLPDCELVTYTVPNGLEKKLSNTSATATGGGVNVHHKAMKTSKEGPYKFVLKGKDVSGIVGLKKKYRFRASSKEDYDQLISAISGVAIVDAEESADVISSDGE